MGNKLCGCENNHEKAISEAQLPSKHDLAFLNSTSNVEIVQTKGPDEFKNCRSTEKNDFRSKSGVKWTELDGNEAKDARKKINLIIRNIRVFIKKQKVAVKFKNDGNNLEREIVKCDKNPIKDCFNASFNCTFSGQTIKGLKQGFGIQKWKDGAVYKGNFQGNQACGIGLFCHYDGDQYMGEFLNDRTCGYGLYRHSNGAIYEGYWKDDCQFGVGKEKWGEDSEYQGEYVNGKKQGIGVYTWADKSRYEGEWYENALHGYGIYYFIDEKIYKGQWQMNSMHGFGEFSWKDGKKYMGYYWRDKKEGFGIYYWVSPIRVYIGFWKNGRQDSLGKYINCKMERFGSWKYGVREKWFTSEKEFYCNLSQSQEKYRSMFKYDIKGVQKLLMINSPL